MGHAADRYPTADRRVPDTELHDVFRGMLPFLRSPAIFGREELKRLAAGSGGQCDRTSFEQQRVEFNRKDLLP
eukprot:2797390-Rhodomonas_salina.3